MTGNRHRVHIIGCGDIGRRTAVLCRQAQQEVSAWVKSTASLEACRELGLPSQLLDLDLLGEAPELRPGGHVLYTVPPPPEGQADSRIRALLERVDADLVERFVLISTSGVYGNCEGRWVDEDTPIHPVADRALRRADAEASLRKWALEKGKEYLILRVPGIYAPDRLPLKRIRSGAPVVRRSEAPWTNRIHADDLAAVCLAALNSPVKNEIINASDDAPSTLTDYFLAIAEYSGLPRPPEIGLEEARHSFSPGMLSYLAESRRIDNRKMKRLLNIELKYPGLQQGLYKKTRGEA